MKTIATIAMIFLLGIFVHAQPNCLPVYGNPVKQLSVNDSLKIAYTEKGKGETILFIHGLAGNISHWEKNIETLSKHFHCIAVDLPGYGHSVTRVSSPLQDQLEMYADVVLSFIKIMNIKKLTIAGHSMGGQIAIIAALKNPGAIHKLVLVAPAGFETFSVTEADFLKNISTPAFFKSQDETAIRGSFKKNFYLQPADTEKLIAYRIAMKQCTGFDAWCGNIVNGIKGMLAHPVKTQLSRLHQKVLILFGENDELIPNKYLHPDMTTAAIAADGSKLISDHTLLMIPQAGHFLQFEKPADVNAAVINFLAN
ncbi:MAG: alpha/beta hydrolase [Ferruginibacter sp.]|nr:alpha/beta hydrolase [Ferruginibacter sp.]